MKEWDSEKNAPLTPSQVTVGSHRVVWWRCPKGHNYQTSVKLRVRGSGCPYCAGRAVLPEENSLAAIAPELLSEWDVEKNAPLTPEQVLAGTHRKIWWRCKKGHSWQAAAVSRIRNRTECPVCAGKKVISGENDLATVFPQLAAQWDAAKNGTLTPEAVTSGSNRRVWWRCEKGHSYPAVIAHRVRSGSDCPYCSNHKVLPGFNDLATIEPVVASQWHPTRNGSLTPQQVTPGSRRKVWWLCDKGHAWRAVVNSRTGKQRCGCPICAGRPLDRCTAILSEPPAEPVKISAQTAGSRGKYTCRRIIMKHKLLSILLCLAMALSLLPTAALAEGAVTYPAGVQDERELRYALYSAPVDGTQVTIKLAGDITLEMLYAAENFGTEKLEDNAAGDTFNRYKLGVHPTAEDPDHWNSLVTNQSQEARLLYGAYYHMSATDERIARLVVKAGQNIELDLNGHTIQKAARATHGDWSEVCTDIIGNYGTLTVIDSSTGETKGTIKGNGYISCVGAVLHNYEGATMTVGAVNVDGNAEGMTAGTGQYVIANDGGTITINGTNIYDTATSASLLVSTAGTMTITGNATLNHPAAKTINAKGGTVEVGDVTITSDTHAIYAAGGTTNITGNVTIKASAADKTTGTLTIDGGAITKAENVDLPAPSGSTWTKIGNTEVLVKDSSAAVVNGVGYATLAAAINAAGNDDTVTLLKDVTENVTIPADKTITLDLNGKTLTNVDDHTILNNGNLTITGTGKVDNISHAKGALYNKGTVIVNGGTFDRTKENGKTSNDSGSNSWYTIKNVGTMTINDGATVQTAGNNAALGKFSSLVSNGYFDANDYNTNKGLDQPILTIDGGTFRGGLNTIKNDDRAKLTINGGTFSNYYQAVVQNHNIAEITGGTFTAASDANAETYGIYNCGCGAEIDLGTLTVSGGTFTGATYAVAEVSSQNAIVNISGGQFAGTKAAIIKSSTSNATIAVSGGTFSSDPSVHVVGNGSTNIVKRDGSEGAYTYTVLAKSGLTSGVYLTDPSRALASNYYVSSTANGVWTVSYSAPYSGGSSSYDPTYSVSTPSKTENGSVTVSPKSASKGDRVTVTVKPDSGYVLETLTVTDKNGNELTLKDKGNGKYTFTMPAGKVEVKATFMEDNSMLNFFYDVPNNAYYYEAVKWAQEKGITGGIGNGLFGPNQPCTRAQIVTFLWRAAGSPEPKGTAAGMTDVVSGSYYEKAVAWAIENGITTGTTATTFSPDATCTRGQSVTFLYRAMGTAPTTVNGFTDVAADSFCADAVAWAVENGVTNGTSASAFSPSNGCTRAQIVTFLFRAYQGK